VSTEWHRRWSEGALGFHRRDVHPDLVAHEERFLGSAGRRVLVPLCGKTVDMKWLADRGHQVVGVELVPQAVEDFFEEQGLASEVLEIAGLPVHRAGAISIITGDVFDVSSDDFGLFDRIWDRAALVALPSDIRRSYTAKLRQLAAPGALLLQNTFEYDQNKMTGPPFSVPDREVRAYFGDDRVELLKEQDNIASIPQFVERGHEYWWVRTYLVHL